MEQVPASEVYYHHKPGRWLRDGSPFTGVRHSVLFEGMIRGEGEYRDGVKRRLRGWLTSGPPAYDYHFFGELPHGPRREWHENGRLSEEAEYEYGVAVWWKRWNAEGTLIEEGRLQEAHPDHATLVRRRQRYADGRVPTAADDKEPVRWVAVPRPADFSVPVPSHLKGWLIPYARIEIEILGTVRCPCGADGVELHYTTEDDCREDGLEPALPPADEEAFRFSPKRVQLGGESFFIVKAVCPSCRQECALYDEDFHGRGFRYPDPAKAARPRPPLWRWWCGDCGFSHHAVELQINLTPPENYFETSWAERYGPDRYADAFDWLQMGIRCCRCWKQESVWMGAEGK
jgi:hypothetical protein